MSAVPTATDVRDLYARCSAEFGRRVLSVDGRWEAPTALPGWTVRDLVRHVVAEERWTPPLLGGETPEQVGSRFDGDLLGPDPVAAQAAAASAALAAVRAPGALERTVALSAGDHPGHEYAMQLAADHLVHAWDLARALGTADTLDADAVGAVGDWFAGHETTYRDLGLIGPRVDAPPGAGAQARLLAMMGRTA